MRPAKPYSTRHEHADRPEARIASAASDPQRFRPGDGSNQRKRHRGEVRVAPPAHLRWMRPKNVRHRRRRAARGHADASQRACESDDSRGCRLSCGGRSTCPPVRIACAARSRAGPCPLLPELCGGERNADRRCGRLRGPHLGVNFIDRGRASRLRKLNLARFSASVGQLRHADVGSVRLPVPSGPRACSSARWSAWRRSRVSGAASARCSCQLRLPYDQRAALVLQRPGDVSLAEASRIDRTIIGSPGGDVADRRFRPRNRPIARDCARAANDLANAEEHR